MPQSNKRRFFSKDYTKKTFLVFYCDNIEKPKRSSGGLFQDEKKAYSTMNDYLLKGFCSWVVSYNE
jgi:hypothetical protein